MTQPTTTPARPPAPAKSALPDGVVIARFWREKDGGPLIKHDHERPVFEDTDMPTGVWWMCLEQTCKTGEWTFTNRETGKLNRPKKRFCDQHGHELAPGRADPAAANPKQAARFWLTQRMAAKTVETRQRAAAAAVSRMAAIRAAGEAEAGKALADLRDHLPSLGVTLGALAGDWTAVEQLSTLEGYILGAGLSVGGTVLAYMAVYLGEIVYARRMGYTRREMPERMRARARSHARWIASGVLATGVWLLIAETIGADITNLGGVLANLLGAVMIGVVNYKPWAAMVARRKAEAEAVREAADIAARAEQERQAAEAEARQQRAEAKRAAEEAAQLEANKLVGVDDDRITAGRKFAERWQALAEEVQSRPGSPVGFEIWRTSVVVEATRKLVAKDATSETVIGWEFLIRAEPGVLAPRGGSDISPFMTMRTWLASMLERPTSMIDLAYHPIDDNTGEPMINHGSVTLSETFPLGEPVKHPGPSGVRTDSKGTMWGFAGRDLRGRSVYRRLWAPGQAGGAGRYGITGSGKTVITQITALNDLYAGILPIIHDAGKRAVDLADFYGVFPIGHTIEHRDVIREATWAEMQRRLSANTVRTTRGLGGMKVPADPTWNLEWGPPIRVTWEEFHMHMKDPRFVTLLLELIRLQRATAIMADLATQGTGLGDTGDNTLREQINQVCMQLMRMTDHSARMAGYTGAYKTSDLPRIPGMMLMVDGDAEPVPYRSAYAPREPDNPASLVYYVRQPDGTEDGTQILFAPELPPETIEVFERHGLMDLWEMGKTESGRLQLQSEADPVQSTALPSALADLFNRQAAGSSAKPRLRAEEVVLALLRHEAEQGKPGLTQKDIESSPWWAKIDGDWHSKGTGVPSHTTINRACQSLAAEGQQVVSDQQKPARWSIGEAGVERGGQLLNVLRAGGVLGAEAKREAEAAGVDVAAIERQALLEDEQARIIRELIREATANLDRQG